MFLVSMTMASKSKSGLDDIIKRIKSVEIQGAKEIAIESMKFLKDYTKKNGWRKSFDSAASALERTRPTAVVLHNCLDYLRENRNAKSIDYLLNQLKTSTQKIADASNFIKTGDVVMTHCHSGVAMEVIKHAWKKKKRFKVYATVTEPLHQGFRTAKELSDARIPVTLITDSAVGFYMPEVNLVIVGSDAMRREGNVNKIGSHNLALAAWEYYKPYYVVASTLKLDKRKKIIIEMRPSSEIGKLRGVKILNPAFDITPWKYVTRIITEKGVMTPGIFMRLFK